MVLPNQRWQIASQKPEQIKQLIEATGVSLLIAQVMLNRNITTAEQATVYINPETQGLPSPLEEFPDLAKSVELLTQAITNQEKIAICGDYDADGMTSTALLLRALGHLGADIDYAIPSRMKEGYGINKRIVEDFANQGVGLILTVDNGISAYEPVVHAVELGLSIIITDHHDLPEKLPPADAILNPKLIPESSPYRGLAGVGVAYILAITTAQNLGLLSGLTNQLLELFTLGTIADLAPLVGVNRRWLKRGLRRLPKSDLAGVQALMQMAGVSELQKDLKPDDIGFKLGPRINAVGRIADPQIVIELLTTDEDGLALERAMQCEDINRKRQQLCEQIELEAIELIEGRRAGSRERGAGSREQGAGEAGEVEEKKNQPSTINKQPKSWKEARVLVIVQPGWHHGVIGIVASRLVERYGVPVFIGTYEEQDSTQIRGSARGIPEFHIFEALDFCRDLLGKFGGHKAAGGFSFPAKNLAAIEEKLSEFAHQCLAPEHLKPLVEIDAEANFNQLTKHLYEQIDDLQPWGIGNRSPVFWTPNVRVIEQQIVGKGHIKLTLMPENEEVKIKAIAWRWREYFPLPKLLDVAYKLKENTWNGNTNIELEIVGVRRSNNTIKNPETAIRKAKFDYQGRSYVCSFWQSLSELRIRNTQGKVLAVTSGETKGLLGTSRENAQEVDVTTAPYYQIIQAAQTALDIFGN